MMDLRELYQEIIIDHNRNPRNHHAMVEPTSQAQGYNPLCGDKLTVYLHIQDDVIQDVSFLGCGCAISQASASLMTEVLKGKTVMQAHELFTRFHHMVTSDEARNNLPSLDKLTVLAGVRAFPARVKCATLAWRTLESALQKNPDVVTTE